MDPYGRSGPRWVCAELADWLDYSGDLQFDPFTNRDHLEALMAQVDRFEWTGYLLHVLEDAGHPVTENDDLGSVLEKCPMSAIAQAIADVKADFDAALGELGGN